jgi:hypothetical protein
MIIVEKSVEWELAEGTEYSEKTCPSAILSTTNLIWPDLGSNFFVSLNFFFPFFVSLFLSLREHRANMTANLQECFDVLCMHCKIKNIVQPTMLVT